MTELCDVLSEIELAVFKKLVECDGIREATGILYALEAIREVADKHCMSVYDLKKNLKEFDYVWNGDDTPDEPQWGL